MNDIQILFMPSCDGIGHAGRMLLVARAVRERFAGKIAFAGNGPYRTLFPPAGFPFHEVGGGFDHRRLRFLYSKWSIPQLVSFVREGRRILQEVVAGELELYDQLKPDLVVWDGRFTVPISASIAGLPLVGIVHPHLTPFSALEPILPRTLPLFVRYPRLESLTKLPANVRVPLARRFWKALHSLFLKIYNMTLTDFGATPASNLEEVFQRSRAAILPDLEVMAPTVNLPKNYHYVGPLVWEPELELPKPIVGLRDLIYVTMGASGDPRNFKPLIESLARLSEMRIVVTLARLVTPEELDPLPPNVYAYDFLPGTEIAKRAKLVICHSEPTTYQALSQGVPVINVPFQIMQELAATRIEVLGAGLKLYASELTPERIARTAMEILETPRYRDVARKIGAQFRLDDGPKRAADIILSACIKPKGRANQNHTSR